MSRDLSGFKLVFKPKVVTNRKTRAPSDNIHYNKKLTKLVVGTVIKEGTSFKVVINYNDYKDKLSADVKIEDVGDKDLTLHFTYQSFDCKGASIVFTKEGQLDHTYLCIHRNETDRIFKNVDNNRYVPFCHNWIVRGWIVNLDGKLYFHFRRCITIKGHNYNVRHWIDDDKFLLNGKWYY